MARFSMVILFAFIATSLFVIKNNVIALESELNQINSKIQADQKAIHVLKAEWTHLNDPERLRSLSAKHANMKPLRGEQIISFAYIPYRAQEVSTKPALIQVSAVSRARE